MGITEHGAAVRAFDFYNHVLSPRPKSPLAVVKMDRLAQRNSTSLLTLLVVGRRRGPTRYLRGLRQLSDSRLAEVGRGRDAIIGPTLTAQLRDRLQPSVGDGLELVVKLSKEVIDGLDLLDRVRPARKLATLVNQRATQLLRDQTSPSTGTSRLTRHAITSCRVDLYTRGGAQTISRLSLQLSAESARVHCGDVRTLITGPPRQQIPDRTRPDQARHTQRPNCSYSKTSRNSPPNSNNAAPATANA
jgi:hypothetical protein